jgi:butyrate kinase
MQEHAGMDGLRCTSPAIWGPRVLPIYIALANTGGRAFIADHVVTDELDDVPRITGHPCLKNVDFSCPERESASGQHAGGSGENMKSCNLMLAQTGAEFG